MEQEAQARQRALNRLAVRDYSSAELRRYLKGKGFADEVACKVVADLEQKGFLNDRKYAEALVRAQAARGKGPAFIAGKLKLKGLSLTHAEIQAALGDPSLEEQLESIRAMLERKYPHYADDPKIYRRAFAALVRRGFAPSLVRKAIGSPPRLAR